MTRLELEYVYLSISFEDQCTNTFESVLKFLKDFIKY